MAENTGLSYKVTDYFPNLGQLGARTPNPHAFADYWQRKIAKDLSVYQARSEGRAEGKPLNPQEFQSYWQRKIDRDLAEYARQGRLKPAGATDVTQPATAAAAPAATTPPVPEASSATPSGAGVMSQGTTAGVAPESDVSYNGMLAGRETAEGAGDMAGDVTYTQSALMRQMGLLRPVLA
jgi:hypothetical protein